MGDLYWLANLHAVGVVAVPVLLLGTARVWRGRLHAVLRLRHGVHADVRRRRRGGADVRAVPGASVDPACCRRHRQLFGG